MVKDPNDPKFVRQQIANVEELQNIMRAGGVKSDEAKMLLHGSLLVQEMTMPDGSEWISVVALVKNCGKPDCPWCKNLPPSADRVTVDLRE